MAKDVIEFVLSLKDEASAGLGKVKEEAKGADDAIEGAGESSESASASLASLGKTAAVAATAVVAVGAAMFQAANAASEMVDKYVLLGIQTGIATQKVVGLDFAAKAAGLGGVQDLQTGLAALVRTANDAADGSKEAADKFAKLGLSPSDLRIDDTDALLRQVADAMGQIGNDSTRAGVAIDLFGARGAKLAAVLGDGSAALDEWGAAAAEAGLVMDGQALQASADMDRAVAQLSLSVDAATLAIGEGLTPQVVELIGRMVDVAPILIDATLAVVSLAEKLNNISPSVAIIDGLVGAVDSLRQRFSDGEERGGEFAAALADTDGKADDLSSSLDGAASSARRLGAAMNGDAVAAFNAMMADFEIRSTGATKAQIALFSEMEAIDAATQGYVATLDTTTQAGQWAAEAAYEQAEAYKALIIQQAEAAKGSDKVSSSVAKTAEAVRSLSEVLASTDLSSLGRSTGGGEAFARMPSGDADLSAGPRGSRPLTEAEISGATGSVAALAGGNVAGAFRDAAPDVGAAIGTAIAGPVGAVVGEALGESVNALMQLGRAGAEAVGEQIQEGLESLLAGILALPELLIVRLPEAILGFVANIGDILGDAVVSLIDGFGNLLTKLPAIMIKLPFQILEGLGDALHDWWRDLGGFMGIAEAVASGVTDWFDRVWQRIKDLFTIGGNDGKPTTQADADKAVKDTSNAVANFFLTGSVSGDQYAKGGFVTRDGLAMVERGERITRPNGESNQSTRAAMSRGNRPPVIIQNTGFMDIDAADRLVDRLERRYGAEGNRSSALFAG
jgi:hypothetical protein